MTKVNLTSTHRMVLNSETNFTFDTILTVMMKPGDEGGIVTCFSEDQLSSSQLVRMNYEVYVAPTVYLTINGEGISDILKIKKHKEIIASCHAIGAKPSVNISWSINDEMIDSSDKISNVINVSSQNNETYDTVSILHLRPDITKGNVTCISRDISGKEIRITGTFQVVENMGDLIPLFVLRYGPYLAVPALIVLMGLCGYRVAKKRLGCRKKDANITRSTEHNSSFWIFPTESTTTNLELEPTRHSQSEPVLTCPDVTTLSMRSRLTEPGDYYTEVQEKPSNEKLFNSKDICLVLNIKMGKIYNRWMGTLTLPNGKMHPVLVTTISDSVLKSRALHWDVYIKRILYLPRAMGLVAVEGMYLHKERLYLLHKHLTFDTLETRIFRDQNDTHLKPCEDTLPAWEVLSYMIGILGGLELIHMHGFLHPGLTTKKVLVTEPGQCKIYDFCLSEDAPNKVVLAKTKRSYNQFAPETLERNEYTKASDVWSIGVVFWETLTGGISPFPDNMVSMDRPTPSPQDWPDHYRQLRNKHIFKCWLKFQKKRPTVTSLKTSLLKVCDSDNDLHRAYYSRSLKNGSSEEASGSAENLYQSDQYGTTMS
ncbi:Ephrin type-A receptor 10 [Holothuria leucospilota]|uniref:Ephrin type-A receptor 10 n=1 Tax=Holothuria leucospilota TaxID=206669 RepID=A0A9Q1H5R1_HOLLE|nr:Ephrin type-A receptor 10 [Holothuria leucospilota]